MSRVIIGNYFADPTKGKPLSSAKIYIGEPDKDPENFPIDVYGEQENGDVVLLPQPIRTGGGGTPVFEGSNILIYVEDSIYSIKVNNSKDAQVYYFPNINTVVEPLVAEDVESLTGLVGSVCIVSDPVRGGVFEYNELLLGVNDGGVVFNGWVRQYSGGVSAEWFGVDAESPDVYASISKAIEYCENTLEELFVKPGKYTSLKRIVIQNGFCFTCSNSVSWLFPTVGDAGFLVDLSNATTRHLFDMSFGSFYSPALNGDVIPGYPGEQVTSSRTDSGLEIIGANRFGINIQTYQGWSDGILLRGASGNTTENFNINVNTHDWNTRAITFDTTNGTINSGNVMFGTMGMAKYQFYFTDGGSGSRTSSLTAYCTGQCLCKEFDASIIYTDGVEVLHDSDIKIRWAYAGAIAGSGETPPEVTSNILLPFVAGGQSSNGLTTDGTNTSAELGYFTGVRNRITIGAIFGTPSDPVTYAGGGPAAGDPIRVRISSPNVYKTNIVKISNANFDITQAPKQLTSTLDESSYNGGVGSASIFEKEHVQLSTTKELLPQFTDIFYMFHQLSENVGTRPVVVIDSDGSLSAKDCIVFARYEGGTNRAVKVTLRNIGDTTLPIGTNFNFFLSFV